MAQALGERLKAERERRGLSAQKAADEMHLDGWVIEALEAGDYERIGPSVYAKGHLKRYASILGMAPADIASDYETTPAQPAPTAARRAPLMLSSTEHPTDRPWPQIAAFTAIALCSGGMFWWWQAHQHPRPAAVALAPAPASTESGAGTLGDVASGPAPAAVVPTADLTAPAELAAPAEMAAPTEMAAPAGMVPASAVAPRAPVEPAASPLSNASPAASSLSAAVLSPASGAASEPEAMPGVGPARLRLSFSADSWVDVHDAAGRRVFAGNGSANSVKTIAGMAPLRVYLGFASGVQLEVNGRVVAIGPQFVTGDVARFEAGADGVLRRDSRTVPANGVQAHPAPPRG
jgi:cytoskeleton protein RodZ